MTEEEVRAANREHNWIAYRVMQHIDTAALFAANFNMPLLNYLKACEEAYNTMTGMLDYKPVAKNYPIATEE